MKKIKLKKLSFKKGTVTELNNLEMKLLNSGLRTIILTNINTGPNNIIFTNFIETPNYTTKTDTQTGPATTNSLLC
jgi:hypothetical protein